MSFAPVPVVKAHGDEGPATQPPWLFGIQLLSRPG